jgi:ABC transporter related protein
MLEISSLTFKYSDQRVLQDFSANISTSRATSILGANGCGKSTLLQLLTGRLSPTHGKISIDGAPLESYSSRELARKVTYIPQFHAPVFSFPVLDVTVMGRSAHLGYFSSPGQRDYDIARYWLEKLEIQDLATRKYTEISGGQRQLVLMASALAQEPEVIMLDEPTSHLDFGNSMRLIEVLANLHNEQKTGIIITTHNPNEALRLGGDALVMHDGRPLSHGPVRESLCSEILSEIYHYPVEVINHNGNLYCL